MNNKYKYMSQAGYTEAEIEKYDELSNRGYSPSQAMDIIRGGKSEPVYVQKYEPKETIEVRRIPSGSKMMGVSAKTGQIGKMSGTKFIPTETKKQYTRRVIQPSSASELEKYEQFEREQEHAQPFSTQEEFREIRHMEKLAKHQGMKYTGHSNLPGEGLFRTPTSPEFEQLRLMKEKIAREQKLIKKIKASEKKALSEEDVKQRAKLRARLEYEANLRRMKQKKPNIADKLVVGIFGSMGTNSPLGQPKVRIQKVRVVREVRQPQVVRQFDIGFNFNAPSNPVHNMKGKSKKSRSTDPFGASNYF